MGELSLCVLERDFATAASQACVRRECLAATLAQYGVTQRPHSFCYHTHATDLFVCSQEKHTETCAILREVGDLQVNHASGPRWGSCWMVRGVRVGFAFTRAAS